VNHTLPHEQEDIEIRLLRLRCNIRIDVETSQTPISQIIHTRELEDPGAAIYLNVRKLRESLNKIRLRRFPPSPNTIEEVDRAIRNHPLVYTLSDGIIEGQQPWYRGQTMARDGSVALIFATDQMLQNLANADMVNADATFRTCPELFLQVFGLYRTIRVGNTEDLYTFPVLFAVMSRKTEDCYTAMVKRILEVCPDFRPQCIQADYEVAIGNAFRNVFGEDTCVVGCGFHFANAVQKWLEIKEVWAPGLATTFFGVFLAR